MTDVPIGGNRINTNPCDEQGQARNWRLAAPVLNPLIINNANPDTPAELPQGWVRFALTSAFTSQLATAHVYDENWDDTGVEITVYDIRDRYPGAAGSEKGIANLWGDAPVYEVLILDYSTGGGGGGGGGDDAFTVMCTADDSVDSYLHAAFFNVGSLAAPDLAVFAQTHGGSGTDQKETLFVKVDEIAGWTTSGAIVLGAVAGATIYVTMADLGSYLIADTTFLAAITVLINDGISDPPEKYRLILCNLDEGSDITRDDDSFEVAVIEPLSSGIDPGVDRITLDNSFYRSAYKVGDYITGIYAFGNTIPWIALPGRGKDGASGAYTGTVSGSISEGSAALPVAGSGTVYGFDASGDQTTIGDAIFLNALEFEVTGSVTLVKVYSDADPANDKYLIMGAKQPTTLECHDYEVPIDVSCGPDGVEVDTTTIRIITSVNGVDCP